MWNSSVDGRGGLRIGEVAELVGVSTRTIRYYHHAGVLPEPARGSSGYRLYALADVVRLLRVRRLVELGLSLAEVSDVLAGSASGEADLQEILRELREDLTRQERRIAGRRAAVDELLARPGDLTRSEAHHQALARLREAWQPDHPALAREGEVSDLLEAAVGVAKADGMWKTYELALTDTALTAHLAELSERFEELAGLDPNDPAVDQLAEQEPTSWALLCRR